MIKYKYVDGSLTHVKPVLSSQVFPSSIVEPDDSYTIRQIYDCWRKGKPTSPHLFPTDFDEEGSSFDDSDASDDFRENPIDICQVQNDSIDAIDDYNDERAFIANSKKKQKSKEQTEPQKNQTLQTPEESGQ